MSTFRMHAINYSLYSKLAFHSLRDLVLVCALLLAVGWQSACAQGYPSKPIRIIASYPPGGGADATARAVAPALAEIIGQSILVENRAGAGGTIGAEFVAKSPPDGHTVLIYADANTISGSLYPRLAYDPIRDFTPVTKLVRGAHLFVAHPSVPFSSIAGLIEYARRNPGKLSYGSPGSGTAQHLAFELFKSQAGNLEIVHIPYRGGAPLITDMVGGQILLTVLGLPVTGPHLRSGRLIALAVTTRTRLPALPDIPTMIESGLPGFETELWFGTAVPARTPAPAVRKLFESLVKAMQDPAVIARIHNLGLEPATSESPEAFTAFVRSEAERWGPIVRSSGARVD